MSALTDYIKLIPRFFDNPMGVINGAINSVKSRFGHLPEDEQEEILQRQIICGGCSYMSKNAVKHPALQYKTDRLDDHCILCACNIEIKTSCLECECGIAAYNKTDKGIEQPLKLKWTQFKKPEDGI